MLEAVLSKCIMHYLKEYLKPLEPGQMELKILQGSVKLYNLQLLPTALIVSHIPFLIRKGSIKYAKIIFPWNNLKNAACEVLIEDIFIVLQFENEVVLKSDLQADQKSLHIKNETNSPSREEQIKIFQGFFESTIDNLRVQIKNVHLRIEFPCDPKPIIIGIYTPDITIQTIDEKGQIVTSIQHPNFVRKQLLIKDFSIYFDTCQDLIEIKDDKEFPTQDQAIQAFTESMLAVMKQDHQYIFKPTQFKSILIHTKDKKQKITNQIQTIIEEISLNLDLQQCRSIIHLNYIWNQFMKRRKYTSCMRPRTFSKAEEVWQYAHKCAIVKNKPHVFKPYLALTILKARTKYVDLFKQAKVSKLSASLLGSPKQKLESLEKKIGQTASIYLREYAEAIYVKEQSNVQSDVTAYDISELKTIFESTEFVFSMHQFYASFEIHSMNLELSYEKDSPLVSLNCSMIAGDISSLKDAVTMNIGVKDLEIVSHVNDMSRNMFQRIHHPNEVISNDSRLIKLSTHIPTTGDVSQFECVIEPIIVTLDMETVDCILGFFTIPNQKSVISDIDGKTVRFEIGELLQIIKKLSNYRMSVNMSQMVYALPYKNENDEIKFVKFEMDNIVFNKNLDKILAKTAPKIPMDFIGSLNLKAKIDSYTLFTTEDIKAKVNLIFINGKLGVNLDTSVDLATLQVFFQKESLKELKSAVDGILMLQIVKSDAIPKAKMPSLIVGRSNISIDVKLKALNVSLKEENIQNEMKIIIGDLAGSCKFYVNSFQYYFLLNNLKITQFDQIFVEMLDSINLNINKENDSSIITAKVNVYKPHLILNYDSINWISNYSKQFNFVPKVEQIDLSQELNQPMDLNNQNSQQIKLNEGLSQTFNSDGPDRSDQTLESIKSSAVLRKPKSNNEIEVSENRIKLAKNYHPSSMILTNSILTQSIADFLDKSGAYDEFTPLIRSIENIPNDSSSDSSSDEENDESTDEDILIPDNETPEENSLDLNLEVTKIWIEMHDTVPNGLNSFFKIESIRMLDYSPAGFKLAFQSFTVGRGTRLTFQPTDFIVPIYQPEPIDIFMEFASAEIFSGDIVSMSTDSAKLFKLMFGGEKSLFDKEVNINIYAKNGCGTFVKENREIITTANVGNAAVCISFKSRELNVDVKVESCNGFYNEDNHQFISMKGPFHCHYKGTMNGQDIFVEIPSSKMVLKHSYLEWGIAFGSLPPDDRPLEPLKIKVKLEPSQINFLAKEADIDSNKISLLQSSSSNIFIDEVKEDYTKVISIVIGKTDCVAFRDGVFDLDLLIEGIHINSDIFDHPIFRISHIHFVKKKGLVKSKIPSVEVNIPISILAQLANEASKFIPKDFIKSSPSIPSPKDSETYLPNFGIDIEMVNLSISFYPSPKRALRLEMPGVKFVLNSSYKISAFEIGSIKVFTIYHSDKPILAIDLSKIQSILTFAEKTDYSLETTTVETIRKLPQKETEKEPLKTLYFEYKMESMQINYTHFFAKMLIGSIFKSMIDCQSLPSAPSVSMDSFTKLGVKFNFSIDKIQINFVIIDPFASVTFTGIKLSYNEKWEASVNNITVLPITKDVLESSVQRSLIKKKVDDDNLVSITIQDGELYAILSECDLYIDLKLLFSLTRFMMASPFLKIKPLLAEINKSKDPNAVIQKMDYVTFSKTLPFALIFNLKKADISVPITLEKDNVNELQIHISSLIDANSTSLSINMSSLSINFYDIKTQTAFPSILSNFTTHFSVEIQEDFSLSFKANILDINLMFSAGDIYLFVLLGRSISNALKAQIFAFEEQNFDIFQLRISSIELISSKMTFVLCKDTRSSSQGVPIFRFIIPPMMFKVKKTTSHQIVESPVQIDVQPYLEYYNVVTGNFDLIIEPIDMHLYAIIIDQQMKFGANILSNLNINFPLNAILKMRDLVSEITESLNNNNVMAFVDLPSMWLSNKLCSTVYFFVNNEKFAIEHNMLIPLFGYSLTAKISFSIEGKNYEVAPNEFNYPTYLSRTVLVVKKPYKGGMMISFERTYQIENNLSFPIEMYYSLSGSKEFRMAVTIEPHQRQPLVFDEEIYVAFIKKGQPGKCKHDTIKLYLLDKSLSIFPIILENGKEIPCIKTVYNDTEIAARIISISSQYVLMNLLPSTLYLKSDDDEVYSVKRGETIDIHFIENDTFTAFLSLDEKRYLSKKSHAKIDYKNTNLIKFYNHEVSAKQKCMIEFAYEKEISQTTIILYIPIVVFNMSLFTIGLEVYNKKSSKIDNDDKDRNYSNSFQLPSKSHHYWSPHSLVDHSDEDSLMITVFATENSKERSNPFDCLTTGRETMLLPSSIHSKLFVPLRCNISNQSRTSILTFSPLITLSNNLDFDFALTPVGSIPEEIPEKNLMLLIEGKTTISEKFDTPLKFAAHTQTMVPYIPVNGTFAISIEGFSTSPSLSLLEPQKTVFKVQNKTNYILIELQVTDVETGILVTFNKAVFPTPILINNQLDCTILAFQLVYLTPFEVSPHSTSIFAFDEPFVYPSVTLSFGKQNIYRISLVEDTEKIEMKKKYNDKSVYIQVKHNKYGNRLVIITQEVDEQPEKYNFVFESCIYGIAASFIDLQIRETALIYLSNLTSRFTFNTEYMAVSVTLKSIQVDDQNPLNPNPTVIYGHFTEEIPYLSFNCLCPINTSQFTSFDYFAINMQRIDVDCDSSFISDWMNFFTSLDIKTIHKIKPKKPSKTNQNSLIALRYFEVTPSLVMLSYNRKSSRPPMLGKVPRFLKFIPSIKDKKMILPGIVISRLTDRITAIETKLIDDYKTAAFNAILGMLGSAGKILKILGIASAIASSLGIKMTSDMTSEVALNSFVKNTSSTEFMSLQNSINNDSESDLNLFKLSEYDNRFDDDELSSCFSYDALSSLMKIIVENSMDPSPLIQFTTPKLSKINKEMYLLLSTQQKSEIIKKKLSELQKEKNAVIQEAGLRIKSMPGIGYGRGIAGVLTKELNDPLEKVDPMSCSLRIRETRPYAGQCISRFNPAIAQAQKIIFKNGGLNEKAREISVSKDGEKKIVIIMTENTIYVFSEDMRTIDKSVKFSDVDKVNIEKEKIVTLTLKNGKKVVIIIDSQISINFLLSILRMHNRFGESLLL